MKSIVKLHIDISANTDDDAFKLLLGLVKQLDVCSGEDCNIHFLKTNYSNFKKYGNVKAIVKREDVNWEFT